MANNQAQDDDILTLLRLLSRRHDKYSKGLQVQDHQRYHQYFQDNIIRYSGPVGDQDDLLFYVKRCLIDEEVIVTESRNVEVYRKTAKNLPSYSDEMVLWDETVCLNIILQNFKYIITMATFSDDNKLDITKRWSHAVFASPNKRRMDSKGDTSIDIDYPHVYFYIDEFEEVFKGFVFGRNQNLAVELVAINKANLTDTRVIFQGSVGFQVAWEHFVKKQSEAGGAGMFYRMLERVRNDGRDSFVRFASLQGPNGRGSGEVALRRGYDDAITPGITSDNDDANHQEANSDATINWKRLSPSKEIQKFKMKAQNLFRNARFDTASDDAILSAQLTFVQIKLYDIVQELTSQKKDPIFWNGNDCLS